jgi:predicted TIM-barrel fold metal-dependent hydrolase
VYDYCQSRDLPVLTEASGRRDGPSRPVFFADVLKEFPRLKLIFAHLGYDRRFGEGADAEVIELAQQYEGVAADTSIKLIDVAEGKVSAAEFAGHLRRIGTDRVLYASNFPYVEFLDFSMERAAAAGGEHPQTTGARLSLETFLSLPLTDAERERIAGMNFRRITGLKAP